MKISLEKNSFYKVVIDGYTSEGYGVAHICGVAAFIPYAIKGETCNIKIVKICKNFVYGKLFELDDDKKILSSKQYDSNKKFVKSRARIVPDCPYYKQCGGCGLRHMTYNEEINFKKTKVADTFLHIAKFKINIDNFYKCKNIYRYRNIAELPVRVDNENKIKIGMFHARSHNVVDISDCLLQHKNVAHIIHILKKWMMCSHIKAYDELNGRGTVRHVCIRTNVCGDVLVCLVVNDKKIGNIKSLIKQINNQIPLLRGFLINYNFKRTNVIYGNDFKVVYGNNYIFEEVCSIKFRLSMSSFFQVNTVQASILYNKALMAANIQTTWKALDLYCGTGTITLLLSKYCREVIGVEINSQAVCDAKFNAKNNKITNVKFICQDAIDYVNDISAKNGVIDLLCVDPPRKGLDLNTIELINIILPKKIIYISCNPSTLARDINLFYNHSYELIHIDVVDMFSRTPHVECIAILQAKNQIC